MERKYGLDIIKECCSNWLLKTVSKHCIEYISIEDILYELGGCEHAVCGVNCDTCDLIEKIKKLSQKEEGKANENSRSN